MLFILLSDPRAVILKDLARKLAKEKEKRMRMQFLEMIEERAVECFIRLKEIKKRVCANVDLYSGFIYEYAWQNPSGRFILLYLLCQES